EIGVGIQPGQIAGRIEAIACEDVLAIDFVESGHQPAAADLQLANLAERYFLAGFRVDDATLVAADSAPRRAGLVLGQARIERLRAVRGEGLAHPEDICLKMRRNDLARFVAEGSKTHDLVDIDAAGDRAV